MQQLASGNKLHSEDISDGTITLSNIGAIGGNFGCPLINLPEVAIIAIGRIQKLPRFDHDGSVYPAAIAKVLNLNFHFSGMLDVVTFLLITFSFGVVTRKNVMRVIILCCFMLGIC